MLHDDILADFPHGDPLLQLKSDEQREGAWKAAQWILAPIGRDGIVVKILSIRFLLGWEPDSMSTVARRYGVTRAAISKQCNAHADALRIPHLRSETSRDNYRRAQLTAWQKRRKKEKIYDGTNQV